MWFKTGYTKLQNDLTKFEFIKLLTHVLLFPYIQHIILIHHSPNIYSTKKSDHTKTHLNKFCVQNRTESVRISDKEKEERVSKVKHFP